MRRAIILLIVFLVGFFIPTFSFSKHERTDKTTTKERVVVTELRSAWVDTEKLQHEIGNVTAIFDDAILIETREEWAKELKDSLELLSKQSLDYLNGLNVYFISSSINYICSSKTSHVIVGCFYAVAKKIFIDVSLTLLKIRHFVQ